jgi:hypothetical protein
MAENKTKPTKVSVASYVAAVADPVRKADAKILIKMMQDITGEKPKMWGPSIIGFGSYHYKNPGGSEGEMPVLGFSPRKPSSVLYMDTGFAGSKELRAKLGQEEKGCMYIKNLKDVDIKVLEQLMKKSVTETKAKYK